MKFILALIVGLSFILVSPVFAEKKAEVKTEEKAEKKKKFRLK